jgi:hypothetical protein
LTEPSPPAEASPDTAVPTRALGLTNFSIEGRRAPALFVVGWLGTIVGSGLIAVASFGAPGAAAIVLTVAGLLGLSIGLIMLAGSQTIERRAAGADYAGPSPVLVFAAIVATSRLAGFAIGLPLQALVESIPIEVGDLLAVLVQAAVFLGIVRLVVVGSGALSWSNMRLGRKAGDAVRNLVGGAVYALPVILVTGFVAVVAVQLVDVIPPGPLPPTGTTSGLLLHLIAGALIAPVYEEILFRGFALTAWRRTVGTRAAIARSSILFVLAHVLFVGGDTFGDAVRLGLVAGLTRVPVAFALGWLYVRTGSLWAPIGLHAAFNGILIVIAELAARTA